MAARMGDVAAFEQLVALAISQACLVSQERIQFRNKSSSMVLNTNRVLIGANRRGALTKSGTRETISIVKSA